MLRRNGPVVKSVESVLRLEGSLWGERFVKEVTSGILIHPAVWPQRTLAENWGLCSFFGGAGFVDSCGTGTVWMNSVSHRVVHFCLIMPASVGLILFLSHKVKINGITWCCYNSFCLLYVRSQVSSLSFSRTVPGCTQLLGSQLSFL